MDLGLGTITEHEIEDIIDEILVWWEEHHNGYGEQTSHDTKQQKPRFVTLAEAIDERRFHV